MKVTKHPRRYLLNLSHPEMEALREVVDRGLIAIYGEDTPLSLAARKALGYWMPAKNGPHKIRNPLKPKQRPARASRTAAGPQTAKDTG